MTAARCLLDLHPTPWRIDQANATGVVVLDSCGRSVFEEWFGDAPDETPGSVIADYIADRHALAQFLVEWSSSANTKSEPRGSNQSKT